MKKIKYIAFSIITLFAFNNKVLAGAYISTSKSQVTVGSTFTVTAGVSGVASWNVHVSASGPVSGCTINAADATESATNGSKSYSASCKATGTGTITLRLSGDTTTEAGANSAIGGTRSVSVVTKSSGGGNTNNNNNNNYQPKKTEPTKSSSTKLEEFGVKGYKVNPEYNNGTNSYSLTVPYDTTKVTIYASRTSNKQTITGIGDKDVKTGENKFSIVVTAEDGTRRTISLNITVDQKPIIVNVNGKEYTVIKKKEELPSLDIEHEDKELNMEEQNVPAYRIDKIGYTLIGLQDSEGKYLYKFKAYKADEKPAEYTLFRYIKAGDIYLIPLDFPKDKIPENYKEYKEKINDVEYTVYKLEENSKYSLLYGTNINTGKDNIYKYESSENTLQLYEKIVKKKSNDTEKYKKLIMILGGVVVFLLLLTTIGFTRKPKDKTPKQKVSKELSDDDSLSRKDIKKIEKDNKKQKKKNKKKQKKGEFDM